MQEVPRVIAERELIEILLVQHKNDVTKMSIEERYLRRMSLQSEKMNYPLGQLQAQIKDKKAYINFLEEIYEKSRNSEGGDRTESNSSS